MVAGESGRGCRSRSVSPPFHPDIRRSSGDFVADEEMEVVLVVEEILDEILHGSVSDAPDGVLDADMTSDAFDRQVVGLVEVLETGSQLQE